MADETKKKILKTIGEAAAVVSPGAKLAKTLADLRNKKKKADFQKGDYSDIDSDETITREAESVKMPEFKRKKTITVPKYPKEFKSGGRVNFKGGGCTTKGMNKKAYGKNS